MVKHTTAAILAVIYSIAGKASAFTCKNRHSAASSMPTCFDCPQIDSLNEGSRPGTALHSLPTFMKRRFSIDGSSTVEEKITESSTAAVDDSELFASLIPDQDESSSSNVAAAVAESTVSAEEKDTTRAVTDHASTEDDSNIFSSLFNTGAKFSDSQLEATFFSLDADSSGAIDREEFGDALIDLGIDLSEDDAAKLFKKYDTPEIDLENFKALLKDDAFEGVAPQRNVQFAMELFKKYDEDGSGSIDKLEFREIAASMQKEAHRRNVISMIAAATGSLVVAKYSAEFQWAQKNFRSVYIDQGAEAAQKMAFPTALLSGDLDKAVASTLYQRGFSPQNTLFAHSVCSDEVNNKDEQLVALMVDRWQEGFSLGGLAGLPFAGKSGFLAYMHHVPDSGKLLVMFAPHVGIGADGSIGALQRDGQALVSNACGAAVGAYKVLQKKKGTRAIQGSMVNSTDTDLFDPQLEKIVQLLEPRLEGIEKSVDPIAFVTYQMYAIVRDLLSVCIEDTTDCWEYAREVAVVGGIMINRRKGGDFFQPLSFETRTPSEGTTDLFEETFGKRPDLVSILGSEQAVKNLYTKGKV
jgi:Ca2+-binding EF-hand superfamily protein